MDPFGEIREEKPLGGVELSSESLLGPSQTPSATSQSSALMDDLLGGAPSVGGGHADDLLGEFLTATAPSEVINRAATEPILPPLDADDDDVRQDEAQPERIQFESGIDLSDIMSKKTEPEEEHIPKAKEHLEDVYAAASVRQPSPPIIPEEPKEEQEMDFRPLPPEPEINDSNEEDEDEELSQEQPPPAKQPEPKFEPAVTSAPPAAKATRAVDDEIAACDLSGLCKYLSCWYILNQSSS
jgi:hypothetical protein